MAYTNDTAVAVLVQPPPVVAELQALFYRLDDAALLNTLTGPTLRGPKGYPVRILWRCFVAKYVMGMGSTAALLRTLRDNPFIAQACGIDSPEQIPHEATFSRFFARLGSLKYIHLLKNVSRALVQRHYQELPGFGERVALDSTTLKGWVNGGKAKPSDPQAKWSIKKNTHGRTEFILGYKLHLLVDCEYELPVAAIVSPGNTHDAARASYVLAEARRATKGKFHPKYVIADKAYSGKPLFHLIRRQYRAQPIIQINPAHKTLMKEMGDSQNMPEW